MSDYTLKIFPIGSAEFTSYNAGVSNPLTHPGATGGEGWQYASAPWAWPDPQYPKMSVDADASAQSVTAHINDTDANPDQLDDYADTTDSQTLTSPITINGTTWPAGTILEDEYEIELGGSDGIQYRLVAISAHTPGSYDARQIIGYAWDGPSPPDGTELSYVYNSNADNQSMVPCFTAGTYIDTPEGPRAIETLRPGDLVLTRNGAQPVRWIGARRLEASVLETAENLRPIRIAAGALGAGLPAADLLVSPQHRMLVRSKIAEQIFGAREVLVAAKHLTALPGIAPAEVAEVTYLHILFDGHEILCANGAETESLYLGEQALLALGPAARREIAVLFPELFEADAIIAPARRLLSGRMGRILAARHFRDAQVLVERAA